MKISIPERINLQDIVKLSQWNDCYILVTSCGVDGIKEFSKRQSQIDRKSEALAREKAKYTKLLEKNSDDAQLVKLLDELNVKSDKLNDEMFDFLVEFIEKRFLGGAVFDSETNQVVQLTKENASEALRQFNVKMLRNIIREMLGWSGDEKKD